MARVYVSPKQRGNLTSLEAARKIFAQNNNKNKPPRTPPSKIRKPAQSPPKLKRKTRKCVFP